MENQDDSNDVPLKERGRLVRSIKSTMIRRKLTVACVLLIGVALLSGGFIYYSNSRKKAANRPRAEEGVPSLQASSQQAPPDEYTSTIISADKLNITDKAAAITILEQYAPKVSDPQKLYSLAVRLGDLYYKSGNFNKAIDWYEQALKTGQPGSENMYDTIGAAAAKAGDKARAIGAYKKMIEIIQKNRSGQIAQQQIENYQAKIKGLGGS